MIDATAKPILQLCLKRAMSLRSALNALELRAPGARWAIRSMDTLDRELKSIERDIEWQEKQNDGRDSD